MTKKRIAVIGANGQLGSDIVKVFSQNPSFALIPLTHADIDVIDKKSIYQVLDAIEADIIIDTAAYHKVDDVEKYPEKAMQVNALGTKLLAEYCGLHSITLVFISTDYVFGADIKRTIPYKESDCPGPVNTYGISKLAGEFFVRVYCSQFIIIRTSGLFGVRGSSGKGGNFVETMIHRAKEKKLIKVVSDQVLSPTYTVDLARQLAILINSRAQGLYHVVSEGGCSWYEFAREIFQLLNMRPQIIPVVSSEIPTRVRRPKYSVLHNYQLKKQNLCVMPHWRDAIQAYLKEKGYLR